MKQLKSDECVFVRYESIIVDNPPVNVAFIRIFFEPCLLFPNTGAFIRSVIMQSLVLFLCYSLIIIAFGVIVLKFKKKFERDLAADKRIDIQCDGDMTWFFSTCYSFGFQTGQITADRKHTSRINLWLIMGLPALARVSSL